MINKGIKGIVLFLGLLIFQVTSAMNLAEADEHLRQSLADFADPAIEDSIIVAAVLPRMVHALRAGGRPERIASSLDVPRGAMAYTPLHYAVGFGLQTHAFTIVKAGANVNVPDATDGTTPLHDACSQHDSFLVVLLLAAQADVRTEDNNGDTPLDVARYMQEALPEDETIAQYEMRLVIAMLERARGQA